MGVNSDKILNKITDEIIPDLTKSGLTAARNLIKGTIGILEKTMDKINEDDSDSWISSSILDGMHESAFDLITTTIGAVLTSPRRAEFESYKGKLSYIKEFCCISLSLPRRTCNTSLLLHLAKYYQNARILCNSSALFSDIKTIIDSEVASSPLKDRLLSNIFNSEDSGSVKPGIILVDRGSYYSMSQKEALVRSEDEFYVFIG